MEHFEALRGLEIERRRDAIPPRYDALLAKGPDTSFPSWAVAEMEEDDGCSPVEMAEGLSTVRSEELP